MSTEQGGSRWRAMIMGFVLGALLLAVGLGIWEFLERRKQSTLETSATSAAPAPVAAPAPEPAPPAPEPAPGPEPAGPPSPRRPAPRPTTPAPARPAEPESAPRVGSLLVESDVPGANVFLDRVFVGPAPATATGLTIGSHQLNVSADGYDGISQSVDVTAGENSISVALKEVKLSTVIDVIHRHTFGSCQGRLFGDAQSVRYETTNTQDAFAVSLADLLSFEIDYMNRMLRVGRRGGKAYTFTDNKPNADSLFVFHREVQKARMKLMRK